MLDPEAAQLLQVTIAQGGDRFRTFEPASFALEMLCQFVCMSATCLSALPKGS
jgi:hypothetical protein